MRCVLRSEGHLDLVPSRMCPSGFALPQVRWMVSRFYC
jgi:hypothetical protein